MGRKQSVLNRQYTDEFKVEAVRLSRAGKLKAADGTAVPVKRSMTEVEAENRRLRRELASTKLDLEIVKKRRRISRKSRGEARLDR